jgi:hypothetical protein
MERELLERAKLLLDRGKQLSASIGRSRDYRANYWYKDEELSEVRSWFDSVFNLFRLITTPDMHFFDQVMEISKDNDLKRGAPYWAVQKLCGNLTSIIEEIELGLLNKAEYIFVATAFDDFLDHAEHFYKSAKKMEAGVLASIVFEDTLRKISSKYNTSNTGESIEVIIDNLTKANAWTSVKAIRIKAYAAVRNKALHANWEEFELRDVGELIKGVRELLEHDLM